MFEGVRSRILGADEFEVEPPGAAGLSVLVRAHPSLQSRLVDLLEGLPRERLGPWAVSGWRVALTETTQVGRFEALLKTWASSANAGTLLKAAATSTLQTLKGRR